ncbi:MAG: TonB-dependent receptor [Burkholderiales bacterium 35-55-47]|jgi:outer membrane receptor protein involved in Fe transport|uniref:TonB-dependent receptor n=1 Tax=Limnohabitans sp. TaxID=1907725 RepID=UPI000BC758CD|nr:TonB-dependent receptor [Limnohabitans sp.]OYY18486.1 MAG: TonB-dependent receptor [Burkholderiales bacterium 35-55-47]OYZ72897.1 MAG: TonB-dependent receptor [Burkholderiales bacterium 24-55-52]OZA99432.1 MAG: TonB-dependent receptor [Burkholderiales bacterium 39-55-53]HQR87347.1 TonB-dependent receptor [Limnohabitans sp.]HQS27605.1 TonB-dependent receptor [Limnohabitans sp.]
MQKLRPTLVSLAVLAVCTSTGALAQAVDQLPVVTVVGAMPIPAISQPLSEIPSAVQTANSTDLANSQALDLSSFMNQRMGGVYVNEVQGNPHQMDVNYRGFTASPLLGTPQGLSVYMDGVRMNQPFGDVVSWDLIPRSAISNMTLMPGSNPLFGLNTLGGALAVQTKSGLTHAGTSMQTTIGSHQRRAVELEHGGRNDKGLHWFVTGNGFNEDGWRDASPSRVRQTFGKLGWKDGPTDVALTLSHANNALTGNGLQEQRMLANDYRSIYTKPDETHNRSTLLNLTGKHVINDNTLFAGNAYYRSISTRTLNGDVNDDALETAQGLLGGGAFPNSACLAAADDDDAEPVCTGLLNRSTTKQKNYGFSGQVTLLEKLAGYKNQFTTGLAYDTNRTDFKQSSEFGYINPDRSVTGTQVFADELDPNVHLKGKASTWSVFATDTISLHDRWHVTMSGRYNRSRIINEDQILPGGGAGSLDGNHVFQRFNPAIGTTYAWTPALTAYLGYNEGNRTPTSIELGCADPANPCKLPNAMAGDPPLKQVVTKTWEAGLRGALSKQTHWTAGLFHAQSTDDILFVAAPDVSSFGYFKNFGKTQRQGIELGLNSQQGAFKFATHYTWLQATYQSSEVLGGDSNSTNTGGNIAIQPGNTIQLTPKHILKIHADYAWSPAWSTGLGMTAFSGVYARGNENNQHQPDGDEHLGSGRTAGYAVFNANARYASSKNTQWMLNVMNLFDRRYSTAGQLGPAAFSANGQQFVSSSTREQHSMSVAPGAPRSVWLSMRHSFN